MSDENRIDMVISDRHHIRGKETNRKTGAYRFTTKEYESGVAMLRDVQARPSSAWGKWKEPA